MIIYNVVETNATFDEMDHSSRDILVWTKDIDEAYDFYRSMAIEKEKADIDDERKIIVSLEKHFVYPDGTIEDIFVIEYEELKGDE